MSSRLRLILVAVTAGLAGWCTIALADMATATELGAGGLTGPMISAAYLAALLLFAAVPLAFFQDRMARICTAIGWVAALPWASWLLFPGMWCAGGDCSIAYPAFILNPIALGIVLLPILSLALRRRRRS